MLLDDKNKFASKSQLLNAWYTKCLGLYVYLHASLIPAPEINVLVVLHDCKCNDANGQYITTYNILIRLTKYKNIIIHLHNKKLSKQSNILHTKRKCSNNWRIKILLFTVDIFNSATSKGKKNKVNSTINIYNRE